MTGLTAAAGVIGAGFASGREAAVFFVAYGKWGWVGLTLTMLVVGLASSRPAHGLSPYLQVVWLLLLWTTLAATLAAAGELLKHLLGWPAPLGSALTTLLAAAPGPRPASARAQALTVVVLATAILLTAGLSCRLAPGSAAAVLPHAPALPGIAPVERAFPSIPAVGGRVPGPSPLRALRAALLYASYTSALLAAGLPAGALVRRRAAWVATALVGLLSAAMTAALHHSPGSAAHALPMLAVAAAWQAWAGQAYAWLLWLAAVNAAAANARALGGRLAGPARSNAARGWVAGLAWAASTLGFGALVDAVYPALGLGWLPALLRGVAGRRPPRLCGPRPGRYN